jgi:hypothetical protein
VGIDVISKSARDNSASKEMKGGGSTNRERRGVIMSKEQLDTKLVFATSPTVIKYDGITFNRKR